MFKLVIVSVFVFGFVLFAPNLVAQTKKPSVHQTDKKSAREKSKKPTKAELAKQAEIARQQQAAREAAQARRQAALEEQRRREQAAREARQRQLNFERGLKDETLQNISADNTDGEDLEVRRAAVNALAGHAGTVVVLEPQTGKVLSIVNQDWAIRKGFKPCSTIKLVTATAGINEGVIDANGNIQTRRFPMEFNDALAFSNNSYFQTVGATGLGNAKMISYARSLGLGETTGINAANESAGKLPYGNNNARIYSHGDDFEVTPLQLAVAVSAISNGGKILIPQIPRAGYEKANFRTEFKREVNVSPNTLQEILPGMVGAVNYGTARRSGANAFAAAGKTGSCIGQGSWLGLFASVAPVVNPQLAVVVITRGSGERGKYAAAIAGKVYQALAPRLRNSGGNGNREIIAKVPETLKPRPQVDAKKSAAVDTDEGADSDDGDVNPSVNPQRPNPKKGGDDTVEIVVGNKNSQVNAAPKNSVKSSGTFPTTVIKVKRPGEISRPRIVQPNNN
ncbi:MAG: penicillin-binding transpeptidase domain-containing protein [Pyrinomonadaceae bacterium]